MIKSRDARRLTVDELRLLVNVANNQNETFATGPTEGGMDAQGILDLHHAAVDNGGVGRHPGVLGQRSGCGSKGVGQGSVRGSTARRRGGEGMNGPLRIGSVFTGIGGIELGLERAGLGAPVWMAEIDAYCSDVLARHWPEIRNHGDVRTLTAEKTSPIDLLSGGFPCTDLSLANNRGEGLAGARSGLWREFARLIRALGPSFVLVENVPALRKRGLGVILSDLAACGYDAVWDGVPASAFGAHHDRDRLFVVAWKASYALRQPLRFLAERHQWPGWRVRAAVGRDPEPLVHGPVDGWDARPALARMDDGLPPRLQRARERALGNAVSPIVSQAIGEMILRSLP